MFLQTELTNKAFSIVDKEFKDKVDKGGKPYIGHLIRVASNIPLTNSEIREKLTVIALLHDLIEDTKWTEDDLRKEFDVDIVDAVVALTKIPGETYDESISRVLSNEFAPYIKLSDLTDNMVVTRLEHLGEYEIERLKKYHKSYVKIKEFLKNK